MSWSVELSNIEHIESIPEAVMEDLARQHLMYRSDILLAFEMAKRAGFKSAMIVGFRTPNPSGGDEAAEITVRGLTGAVDYNKAILKIIGEGLDDAAIAHQLEALTHGQGPDQTAGRDDPIHHKDDH